MRIGGGGDMPGMLGVKAELLIILCNVGTYTPNDTESHPTCCDCSNTSGCSLKSHIILSQQWRRLCFNCDAVQLGRHVLMFQSNMLLAVWGQQKWIFYPSSEGCRFLCQYTVPHPRTPNLIFIVTEPQILNLVYKNCSSHEKLLYCLLSPRQHAATKTSSDLYVWTKINQNYPKHSLSTTHWTYCIWILKPISRCHAAK